MGLSEFKTILISIAGSRTARAIQRDPVTKNQIEFQNKGNTMSLCLKKTKNKTNVETNPNTGPDSAHAHNPSTKETQGY